MRFAFNNWSRFRKFFIFFSLLCLLCEFAMAQNCSMIKGHTIKRHSGKEHSIQNVLAIIKKARFAPKIIIISLQSTTICTLIDVTSDNSQSLKQALQNTKVRKSAKRSSMYWGIILFDENGQRIASIYVDLLGNQGYINSTPVTFKPTTPGKGLSEWLYENFFEKFKTPPTQKDEPLRVPLEYEDEHV